MANRHRGEGRLDVGGRTYTLVYDTNALAELEDVLNAPFDEVRRRLTDKRKVGFREWRALLYAGLRARHPDVSLREAGDLIDEAGGLPAVVQPVMTAFIGAFPAPTNADEGRPPRAAGTGSDSSS